MIRFICLLSLVICFSGVFSPVRAQDGQEAQEQSFFSRFMFSGEELEKLKKALMGGYKKAPEPEKPRQTEEDRAPETSSRIVSLAGLIYSGPQDWTFWLNGRRVTPDKVPEEVQNLYVTKYYIDFSWFDRQTNQLYPIRLRPHQSFHLDTKVFFTGTIPPATPVDGTVD